MAKAQPFATLCSPLRNLTGIPLSISQDKGPCPGPSRGTDTGLGITPDPWFAQSLPCISFFSRPTWGGLLMLWAREKHTVPPGTVLDLSCLLPPGASTGAGLSACHPPIHQSGQLESSACALQYLRPGLTVLDQTDSACKLFAISEEARKTNRAGQCPGPGQAWRKPRHRGHPGKGECHSEAATTAGQEPPRTGGQ